MERTNEHESRSLSDEAEIHLRRDEVAILLQSSLATPLKLSGAQPGPEKVIYMGILLGLGQFALTTTKQIERCVDMQPGW